MPNSDYATFDFYNYRSDALQAIAGFPVPNAVEPEAASSPEQASVIGAEALNQLITALYESAMDPQNWKVFLELLRSSANGNYASLVVRDPHGENVGWVISATGGRSEVIPYDPYA